MKSVFHSSRKLGNKVSRLPSFSWVSTHSLLLILRIPELMNSLSSGYFNPLLAHGEERAVKDAKIAGANGFIIVDLPPEEAVDFRKICTAEE